MKAFSFQKLQLQAVKNFLLPDRGHGHQSCCFAGVYFEGGFGLGLGKLVESFIVLMMIAWTYLLHAHYRSKHIEYRYFTKKQKYRVFDRTKRGAFKDWELERCLNEDKSPIDNDTANNLRFLVGLRHEIEHQMTSQLDNS